MNRRTSQVRNTGGENWSCSMRTTSVDTRFRFRIYERDELLSIFECENVRELRLLMAWLKIKPFYVHPPSSTSA